MADIDFDIRDIMLEAAAEVEEIMREALGEIELPQQKEQMRMMWASVPEDMKEKFKRDKPTEYKELMQALE
jgi:hypothetical protein